MDFIAAIVFGVGFTGVMAIPGTLTLLSLGLLNFC